MAPQLSVKRVQRERGRGSTRSAEVLVVGISYKTAPISVREGLARSLSVGGASKIRSRSDVKELVVLSTCNRFELYLAVGPSSVYGQDGEQLLSAMDPELHADMVYRYSGMEAVGHLFRVSSGLDSVVLGEPQIMGQVRSAAVASRISGDSKGILSPLFDRALTVGKGVRERYELGTGDDSLSDLAVAMAADYVDERTKVLLIGTGKMVQFAVRKIDVKPGRIFVASKRKELPAALSGCDRIDYSDIPETAPQCAVVISATATQAPILEADDLRGNMKRIVVDLGMPRNVSPAVRGLRNVRLLDLDDLADLAPTRRGPGSLRDAEADVSSEAARFYSWVVKTRLTSTLASVHTLANGIRVEETESALRRIAADPARAPLVVEEMGRRIVSKLMSRPTAFARNSDPHVSDDQKMEILGSVFGVERLDEENNQDRD